MGHAHLSSLEQSYQGATYYIQPILIRENKRIPITSGNLEFINTGTKTFLEPLTDQVPPILVQEGYCQEWQKDCRLPKDSRNTIINANSGDISNTLCSQVLSHHMQQKRLLELKAPNWKERAFTDGSCITSKENGYRSIGAGVYHPQSNKITTANPGETSINKTITEPTKRELQLL